MRPRVGSRSRVRLLVLTWSSLIILLFPHRLSPRPLARPLLVRLTILRENKRQIEFDETSNEFYLCDLGSLNGTYMQMVRTRRDRTRQRSPRTVHLVIVGDEMLSPLLGPPRMNDSVFFAFIY